MLPELLARRSDHRLQLLLAGRGARRAGRGLADERRRHQPPSGVRARGSVLVARREPASHQWMGRATESRITSSMYNFGTRRTTQVEVPGRKFWSWPRWTGPDRLVASIGGERRPDSIVLVDVSQPSEAKVVRTLWSRSLGPDVDALWPTVSPSSGRASSSATEGRHGRSTLLDRRWRPTASVLPRIRRPQADRPQPLWRRPVSPLRLGLAGPRAPGSCPGDEQGSSRAGGGADGGAAQAKPAPARGEGWRCGCNFT